MRAVGKQPPSFVPSYQSLCLTERESLELANQLLRKTNDYSQLRKQYLSTILEAIAPRKPPEKIGLSEVPRLEAILGINRRKTRFVLTADDLWRFVSDQVELISSFSFKDGKVILSSSNRRRVGTYETPSLLADALADLVLTNFIHLNIDCENLDKEAACKMLKTASIVDPACGTGRLLHSVMHKIETILEELDCAFSTADRMTLRRELVRSSVHGIDRDAVAAIATRFLFWYSSLDENGECVPDIRVGDSLSGPAFGHFRLTDQETLDSFSLGDSFNWKREYPNLDGFDIAITNPPWERQKTITRESLADMVSWSVSTRAEIDRVLGAEDNGHLRARLEQERKLSAAQASFFRRCGYFPLSSKGDLNLYALFIERCNSLLSSRGVGGLIVPTGIATDFHLRNLLFSFVDENRLLELHDFINTRKLFRNVDGRYRYSYFVFSKRPSLSHSIRASFYNLIPESMGDSLFLLTKKQISTLNPLTNTFVIPKSPSVIPLLMRVHKEMPLLDAEGGDSWGIGYKRQADMTNDSHLFVPTEDMVFNSTEPGILRKGRERFLRVYEGKMVDRYNHRAGSTITKTGWYRRSGYSVRPTLSELANPCFYARSRYAISTNDLAQNARLRGNLRPWHLVFKDITAATNRRTVRAAILPACVVSNKLPTLEVVDIKDAACLLATLNSAVFDFISRQKIGNITLNWYILRQLPVPRLSDLHDGTVNGIRIGEWLVDRVRRLTYVSYDLEKWNQALEGPRNPFPWRASERDRLEAEIDSLMLHLYRTSPKEAAMILNEFPQLDSHTILNMHSHMAVSIP